MTLETAGHWNITCVQYVLEDLKTERMCYKEASEEARNVVGMPRLITAAVPNLWAAILITVAWLA